MPHPVFGFIRDDGYIDLSWLTDGRVTHSDFTIPPFASSPVAASNIPASFNIGKVVGAFTPKVAASITIGVMESSATRTSNYDIGRYRLSELIRSPHLDFQSRIASNASFLGVVIRHAPTDLYGDYFTQSAQPSQFMVEVAMFSGHTLILPVIPQILEAYSEPPVPERPVKILSVEESCTPGRMHRKTMYKMLRHGSVPDSGIPWAYNAPSAPFRLGSRQHIENWFLTRLELCYGLRLSRTTPAARRATTPPAAPVSGGVTDVGRLRPVSQTQPVPPQQYAPPGSLLDPLPTPRRGVIRPASPSTMSADPMWTRYSSSGSYYEQAMQAAASSTQPTPPPSGVEYISPPPPPWNDPFVDELQP